MKIASNNEQYLKKEKARKPFIKKFRTLILLLFGVLLILSLLRSFDFFDYLKLKGVQGPAFRASPADYISAIVTEMPSSIITPSDLEEFKIDIKFKDWQKLSTYRNTAMSNDIISINEKDYVDAIITFRGKRLNSKLRLKGEWTDHLRGNKWSLRVKLEDDNYIEGIKKFSIQNPATRDFQGQLLIDKMLHEYKILTPRYFFVNVDINGDNIGIMAFAEHFSKELLENSNRKESVIIKFDEADLWQSRSDNKIYAADEYRATIIPFVINEVKNNSNLYGDYLIAVGLMRGYLKGELKAHDVFDVKLMGDFLAIYDLWGEGHGFVWHNLRFYYNPISAKLEPIGFDQMLYHTPDTLDLPKDWIANSKFLSKIRDNGFIKLVYINTLKELRNKLQKKQYLNQYIDIDVKYEDLLRREFFFKPPPLMKNNDLIQRLNLLISNSTESIVHMSAYDNKIGWAVNPKKISTIVDIQHKGLTKKSNLFVGQFYKYGLSNLGLDSAFHGYKNMESSSKSINLDSMEDDIIFPVEENVDLNKYQKIANLYYYNYSEDGNGTIIEVQNLIPFTLEIKSIKVIYKEDMNLSPKEWNIDNIDNFIQLSKSKIIKLDEINHKDVDKIFLTISTLGGNDGHTMIAESYTGALTNTPIPQSTVLNELRMHSYLTLDHQKRVVNVKPGTWLVKSPLIVPPGYTLKATKGTVLEFANDGYILSHGQVSFIGTLEDPIILKPHKNNKFWKGVAILGNSKYPKSILKNVNITGTTALDHRGWIVDAGIFIYQAEILLDNIKIINNNCEDAINIVGSKYNIKDIVIKDTMIDGLDVDFSDGKIFGGVFTNIGQVEGADAIDFSGSSSELEDLLISGVYDKGISIGEKSNIQANNINLSNLSIGVAIKDGSSLIMEDSKISDADTGVLAFIKKRKYDAPIAHLNNIEIKTTTVNVRSDIDSTIFLDGILVDNEKSLN